MPFFISITIETHSVLNLEANVAHIWISVGAVHVEFGPKCCVARCLLRLSCFKSWFFLFVGQIPSDCDWVCIKVSIRLKTDFCCICAKGWNRLSLLISWGMLETGLAQDPHLLYITQDGYFCTKFLSGPWIHRQVFLLAIVPKKVDNIYSIIYIFATVSYINLILLETSKFSD